MLRLANRFKEAFTQLPSDDACWVAFRWTSGAPVELVQRALGACRRPGAPRRDPLKPLTDAERQAARAEPALAALPRRRESLPEDLRRLVMSHADGREATSPYQIIAPELPTTAAFEIARRRDQLILVFNTATRFTAICTARCPMKHSLFKCAPFLRAAFVFRLEQAEFDECVTGPLDTQMENCHQPGAGRRFDMACGVIDKRAARAGESNRSGGLMEHPRIGLCQPYIGRVDDRIEGVCETGRGKIVGKACRSVREQGDGTRAANLQVVNGDIQLRVTRGQIDPSSPVVTAATAACRSKLGSNAAGVNADNLSAVQQASAKAADAAVARE